MLLNKPGLGLIIPGGLANNPSLFCIGATVGCRQWITECINMQTINSSERIKLLRPGLIFLIICTHIQGNLYRPDIKDIELNLVNYLHVLLSGVLAVSALPLLSIISGYLAGITLKKYGYWLTLYKKIIRILLPMLAWNLILALYIYNKQKTGLAWRSDLILYPFNLETSMNWLYGLFSLFRLPANQPLYFLKELFICFLLIPVLFRASQKPLLCIALLLVVAYMAVSGTNFGFFHRIDIYGFFLIGLAIYNRSFLVTYCQKFNTRKNRNLLTAAFAIYSISLSFYAFQEQNQHFYALMKVSTLIGPLVFWILSGHTPSLLKRFLSFISPASFGAFLGHILILNVYWNTWVNYFKTTPLTDNYWLFWSSSMVLCFACMGIATYLYHMIILQPLKAAHK